MPSSDSPTVHAHKQQVWWQILVPMILTALLGLAAGGLTIAASVSDTSRARLWADVSIIWLLAPALLIALAGITVLIGMIYALVRLARATPRYTSRAQQVAGLVAAGTRKAADGVTKPFVWFRQAWAIIKSIFKL